MVINDKQPNRRLCWLIVLVLVVVPVFVLLHEIYAPRTNARWMSATTFASVWPASAQSPERMSPGRVHYESVTPRKWYPHAFSCPECRNPLNRRPRENPYRCLRPVTVKRTHRRPEK